MAAPVQRLHWSITAASLVAMGTLFWTAPHLAGLPLVAVAVLAAPFIPWRLPRNPLLTWSIRLVLFTAVILSMDLGEARVRMWYLKPEYSSLAGCLCAIELAIHAWQARAVAPRGEVLVLSGLVMAAATNTDKHDVIFWAVPAYIVLLMFVFRDFRPRAAHRPEGRVRRHAVRAVAGGVILLIGLGITIAAERSMQAINRLTIQPPSWLRPGRSQAGLSPSPFLGASPNVQASTLRVLRVDGLAGDAHLRGLSFDTYASNRWGPPFEQRRLEPVGRNALASSTAGKRWSITRWRDSLDLVYAPLSSSTVAPMPGITTRWDPATRAIRSGEAGLAEYVYEAVIPLSPTHQGPLCPPLDAETRQRCLDVPGEIDPRVRDLAAQIVKGLGSPAEKARAIEAYLQKNYRYSLRVDPAEGERISYFLLNRQPAHCQYFASGAAMLLRCAGVPSRYVSGYYAHEMAGRDSTIVRDRDAHAWTEAWIDGVGWVSLDATPPDGRPDLAYPRIGWLTKAWEWIKDTAAVVGDWLGELGLSDVLLTLAGIAGVILLIQWVRVLLRRRRRPAARADAYAMPEDLARMAAGFQAILARLGVPCAPEMTWRVHLVRLAGSPPEGLDLDGARRFVDAYDRVRFGRDGALPPLEELLESIEKTEKERTSRA